MNARKQHSMVLYLSKYSDTVGVGGSGKRQLADGSLTCASTIGKLRLPLPPVCLFIAWFCVTAGPAWADSVRQAVRQGNELYVSGKYSDAVKRYDEALVDQSGAVQPKFNKADSYYKLDDLGQAIDLYQQVAAESKDMQMVAKAKYNLGDCFFQRGAKQKDSDLQKAVDDMKSSIACWRQVLDIDPKNEKAAKNIEVARLTIKDILDQIKKQQEQKKQDPNQPQDPNQAKQAQQKQDPNQTKQAGQKQDPNQAKQQEQQPKQDQGQAKPQEQRAEVRDATAQEILDKEQRQKDQRQILQRAQVQKVEKDW